MKIKVLIVDDSALIRSVMSEIIGSQPDMEVVGVAPDPLVAREMIKQLNPDVLTLDVEMPKMDGLDFLERLMRLRPMPVIMVSSLTERGSEITMRALELGAIDFVTKPKLSIQSGMIEYTELIADKIRIASKARVRPRAVAAAEHAKGNAQALPALRNPLTSSEKLIIIGASTGGTEAIKNFLMQMPSDCPGILITQHMPATFTTILAEHITRATGIPAVEGAEGMAVERGKIYVAPGEYHMSIEGSASQPIIKLLKTPPENFCRPSVNPMLRSLVKLYGKRVLKVILTGMGQDGLKGAEEAVAVGGAVIAQDEASSVVWGMPGAVATAGLCSAVLPLTEIAPLVRRLVTRVGL